MSIIHFICSYHGTLMRILSFMRLLCSDENIWVALTLKVFIVLSTTTSVSLFLL
jgi:hypothetical protein